MARIRSIYPGTPTDPEFAANPVEGRLLALYSLTIADDAGNLERNPLGLMMALFPGDEWATVKRITELVDTLIVGRFYEPYEVEGKQYLHVRNFAKYQKPDHPTAPRYPLFPGQEFTYHVRQGNTWVPKTVKSSLPDRSVNVQRTLPERKANVLAGEELELERKGKELDLEGNGEDGRGPGREGKPEPKATDARPLAFEGQAASSQRKDNGNGTATASGKKGRVAEVPSTVKEAALNEVARLVSIREIDLAGASEKLRAFGFTHSEINSPALVALLRQAVSS